LARFLSYRFRPQPPKIIYGSDEFNNNMAGCCRVRRGLSLPINIILAGTLLIIFALMVIAARGMLDPDYGQSLNEDVKSALDRGCIRWQNLRDDIGTNSAYKSIMVNWNGQQTSVWRLCREYFDLNQQGDDVIYVKCWNYCMNDNVQVGEVAWGD